MTSSADVCVLLPTLNESATIVEVIRSYQEAGFDNILSSTAGRPTIPASSPARPARA